jgi:hypothetical protein
MTKILDDSNNIWFKEIAPSSFMNEGNLEQTVLAYLSSHLKNHFIVKCKMDIKNSKTRLKNQPDLAIISKDYKEWYVVEVELSSHRFKHIEEQVDTFKNGIYNYYHANYIYRQDKSIFDESKLKTMVDKFLPKVMVIVNDKNCNWVDLLKPYKCELGIFQIYYDKNQNRLYRFNGHFPIMKHDFATCKFINGLPLMIELLEQDFLDGLDIKENDIIDGVYNGKSTNWRRVSSGKRVFLECIDRAIPLDPLTHRYMIIYNEVENDFEFIKA